MAGAYNHGDDGPAVDGHGIARQGKGEDMAAPARLSGPDAVKGPADCAGRAEGACRCKAQLNAGDACTCDHQLGTRGSCTCEDQLDAEEAQGAVEQGGHRPALGHLQRGPCTARWEIIFLLWCRCGLPMRHTSAATVCASLERTDDWGCRSAAGRLLMRAPKSTTGVVYVTSSADARSQAGVQGLGFRVFPWCVWPHV